MATKYYILYNPLAGGGDALKEALLMRDELSADGMADMTKITNYGAFLSDKSEHALVICGGDGTLNRFVNDTADIGITNEVYCHPTGTGNDFIRELDEKQSKKIYLISQYIRNLPVCRVNGKTRYFINGVGYGIDGYCCEQGDRLKERSKPVNYTKIAIRGVLFSSRSFDAEITVDGEKYEFKNVWIAPAMHGRYYGGGMIPAPMQSRSDEGGDISLCVFHCRSRLKTLMMFPSIFKGEHIKYKNNVTVIKGKSICVKFSASCPLQIDGETYPNVNEYSAYAFGSNGYKKALSEKTAVK